jgi:hypothetical protein
MRTAARFTATQESETRGIMNKTTAFPTLKVVEILDVAVPTRGDTYVSVGFTTAQLQQLVEVGAADRDEQQNDAPSVGAFLDYFAAVSYPVSFIGYVIFPPRPDARVSVEGFEATPQTQADRDGLVKAFRRADEFECLGKYCRAWWD